MPTFSCASAVEAPRCGVNTHFLRRKQREIRRRRLGFVNVQRDAGEVAGIEQRLGGRFIDQSAAGAVDDQRAGIHQGEAFAVEDVPGLRR